ncbi:hypothetical protein [Hyphomicrobium sp.]|uniref:hypothetical protein n=1 Tax=Hyphomicrobium sp. TaxID=82 RepID=UPI002E3809B4|nr:hypothetical protein [Hyphomicrobium sp.]HEX2841860.1 hypothetical protein [Hyphomicrobium sp.]
MSGLAHVSCVFSLLPLQSAAAEIHDYMVLRLIYLGTSCGTQKLERIDAGRKVWRRFRVECRDVASYPHGIIVTCTDPADDRSCKIETPPAAFKSLELLRPNGG